MIPEENEVSSDVNIIKPLNGIDVKKVTPIIKKIENPSVKLSPLDLAPNDYLKMFDVNKKKNGENLEKLENTKEKPTSHIKLSSREENSKADQELLKSVSK